jgi:hypothetical protein
MHLYSVDARAFHAQAAAVAVRLRPPQANPTDQIQTRAKLRPPRPGVGRNWFGRGSRSAVPPWPDGDERRRIEVRNSSGQKQSTGGLKKRSTTFKISLLEDHCSG